jgi:hypothetical protein
MPNHAPPLPVTSSTEPAWATDARSCYCDVVAALHDADVPCAVGGAFAIHKHTGVWRATKDLDLLLESRSVPAALDVLRRAGFHTCIEDPVWLAKASRGPYFVDLISGLGNASLRVESSWIERAAHEEILGVPTRILAAEEMIASKVFVARRERFDGSDVVHLVRACGDRIDWMRLLQLLDHHWQLLLWSLTLFAYIYPGRSELVPERIWTELMNRFAETIRHPRRDAAFRGSLIDPLMFAIDVNEWGERNIYREYCETHPELLVQGAEECSE